MALILSIETSEKVCSVSLSDGLDIISSKEISDERSHASMLTVIIDQLLSENNLEISQLKAVAVSKGPGSYTGLRIGVSVAKGICYALNIPLISINTLQALSNGLIQSGKIEKHLLSGEVILCPLMDARRMEVYKVFCNLKGEIMDTIDAQVIESNSFQKELAHFKIIFFGSGAEKCSQIIKHDNAIFIEDFIPRANYMYKLAYESWLNNEFENLAYFEPFYLKNFVATSSYKNTLAF